MAVFISDRLPIYPSFWPFLLTTSPHFLSLAARWSSPPFFGRWPLVCPRGPRFSVAYLQLYATRPLLLAVIPCFWPTFPSGLVGVHSST